MCSDIFYIETLMYTRCYLGFGKEWIRSLHLWTVCVQWITDMIGNPVPIKDYYVICQWYHGSYNMDNSMIDELFSQ